MLTFSFLELHLKGETLNCNRRCLSLSHTNTEITHQHALPQSVETQPERKNRYTIYRVEGRLLEEG